MKGISYLRFAAKLLHELSQIGELLKIRIICDLSEWPAKAEDVILILIIDQPGFIQVLCLSDRTTGLILLLGVLFHSWRMRPRGLVLDQPPYFASIKFELDHAPNKASFQPLLPTRSKLHAFFNCEPGKGCPEVGHLRFSPDDDLHVLHVVPAVIVPFPKDSSVPGFFSSAPFGPLRFAWWRPFLLQECELLLRNREGCQNPGLGRVLLLWRHVILVASKIALRHQQVM